MYERGRLHARTTDTLPMADGPLPLLDTPEWLDHLVTDLALSVGVGALVSYVLLVFPDPDPLVSLPHLLTVPPILWLWIVLSVLWFPLFRWAGVGERTTTWWDRRVE